MPQLMQAIMHIRGNCFCSVKSFTIAKKVDVTIAVYLLGKSGLDYSGFGLYPELYLCARTEMQID